MNKEHLIIMVILLTVYCILCLTFIFTNTPIKPSDIVIVGLFVSLICTGLFLINIRK